MRSIRGIAGVTFTLTLQLAVQLAGFAHTMPTLPLCGVGAVESIEKLLCLGEGPGIVWTGLSEPCVMFVVQLSVGQLTVEPP